MSESNKDWKLAPPVNETDGLTNGTTASTTPSWEADFDLLWGIAPEGSLKYNKGNDVKTFIRTLLSQTLSNERQRHERTLIALLPLAKGYVHNHDVGRNREMITEAEAELERLEAINNSN